MCGDTKAMRSNCFIWEFLLRLGLGVIVCVIRLDLGTQEVNQEGNIDV